MVHIPSALYWKAWHESRTRFLILLASLVFLVAFVIFSSIAFLRGYAIQYPSEPLSYTEYVWQALYNYYFQGLWILSVLILGLGGLLRERVHGFSNYTLGLPVSRKQIMTSRFLVGIGESVVLGIVPSLFIPVFSMLVGHSYPLTQALGFGFLLVTSGSFFYSFSFLVSSLFSGEFTAFLLGTSTACISFFAFKAKAIHRWSIFDVMNGARSV